ncbi:MAG: YceI family protein [Pseudomonadota bacterium]|nr:YceI family protein [Pseudomonadota bacterium]
MKHLSLALLLALGACQSPAPKVADTASTSASTVDLTSDYMARLTAGAAVYQVDAAISDLRIYVFRGGKAAKLGHNHVLSAPRFEGYVSVPSEAVADAAFDLQFRFDELQIDDPALREQTGGNFAGARSEADIAGTTKNMLGPSVLNASERPFVRIRSLSIAGDWPMLVSIVAIDMHDATREREVLLQVERDDQQLRARGELVLRQTEFGVTPLSILGGVIAVQDPVAIRFDLRAKRISP